MKPTRAKEVLYDSETVLRLVERQLKELHDDMELSQPSHLADAAPASAASDQAQKSPPSDSAHPSSPTAPARHCDERPHR